MTNENNNRILVIDDMDSIHQCFRKILLPPQEQQHKDLDQMNKALFGKTSEKKMTPSFEIDFAYQGEEGLTLVKKAIERNKPYALAFIDVQMPPGDDGVITASNIWKVDPSIEIVLCTAYAKYTWEEIIHYLGETDDLFILKKPFDSIEVQQLATALTKKWDLNRTMNERLAKSSGSLNDSDIKNVESKNSIIKAAEAIAAINESLRKKFPEN